MRVPVLLRIPGQEPLIESASVARDFRVFELDTRAVRTPDRIELDPTFAAIPTGSGLQADMSLE
jgi:hypothetical protein